MKRHPQLQDLSREHHGALKLARAARQAAESGNAGNVVALERAGETTLVQRTLKEHAELRALASAFSTAEAAESTEAAMLSRFGDLLASHVRFEERELFEAAQSLMAAA